MILDETVKVSFNLSDGGKVEEDNDFISIRCNPIDSDDWELYESVSLTQQSIELQLPSYGGIYYIVYVRAVWYENIKTHVDLSEPQQISLSFKINEYCPEESIAFIKETHQVQKVARRRSIGTIDGTPQLYTKSSTPVAKAMPSRLKISFVVEDLRSIKSLLITAFVDGDMNNKDDKDDDDDDDEMRTICKVTAWRFKELEKYPSLCTSAQIVVKGPDKSNETSTSLLLEIDVICASKTYNVSRTQTYYGLLNISGAYIFRSGDGLGIYNGNRGATGYVLDQNSPCMMIRMPYVSSSKSSSDATSLKSNPASSYPLLADKSLSLLPKCLMLKNSHQQGSFTRKEYTISCSFCHTSIFSSTDLFSTEQLPTGLFDHVMHEMMCNELPIGALTSNDLVPKAGKALLGLIHVVINPTNVCPTSNLTFTCKLEPSLLEIVTSQMGVFISSTSVASQSVLPVDISTCLIHCSRCGQYLGDAKVDDGVDDERGIENEKNDHKEENDNGVYCQESIKDFSISNACCERHRKLYISHSNSFSFSLCDASSIKLRYDRIHFQPDTKKIGEESKVCSLENVAIRSMLILSEIHRVAHFRWRLAKDERVDQTDDGINENHMSLVIKLMNKDYLLDKINAADFSTFPTSLSACQAVKILFKENCTGNSSSVEAQDGNNFSVQSGCIELPIVYNDYLELRSTLRKRSVSLNAVHGMSSDTGSKGYMENGKNKNCENSWISSALYL